MVLDMIRKNPTQFWLRAIAVAAVVVFFALKRSFWTPDTLFIVLLGLAVVFGKVRPFLVRFVPFVGLLLVYDSFRGIADNLNQSVHYTEMINFDRFVFGVLPTDWLQSIFWHGHVRWYDFYFYFLYTLHFVAPLLVALLLWWRRERLYWPFVCGLVMLSFAGFITYVLFPAAPPWLASDNGYIEPIYRISSDVWAAMGVTNFSEVYSKISPNPVAAVPSLHAAYPTLMVLYVMRAFGWRKTWWLVVYPVSMWLGIVYLGEHYVFDVILGIAYAVGAYYGSLRLFEWARSADGLQRTRIWRRGHVLYRRAQSRLNHHNSTPDDH